MWKGELGPMDITFHYLLLNASNIEEDSHNVGVAHPYGQAQWMRGNGWYDPVVVRVLWF